jgi:hypothetical protein
MQQVLSLQQELRDRLGLTVGLIRSSGWTLNIMVDSVEERDKVLDGDLQKLCREAMAMGCIHMVLKVRNARIRHLFRLSTLKAFDQKLIDIGMTEGTVAEFFSVLKEI